jgi:hypothetical protein
MNALGTPNLVWSLDMCGWGRGYATRYVYGVASVATGSAGGAIADIEKQRLPDPLGLQSLLYAPHTPWRAGTLIA